MRVPLQNDESDITFSKHYQLLDIENGTNNRERYNAQEEEEEIASNEDSSHTCVCNTKCNTFCQNYSNRERQSAYPVSDSTTSEDSITRRCHYEQYLAFISTANSLKDLCKFEKAKMLNRLCEEVHRISSRISSRTESYRDYGSSCQGRSRRETDRKQKERCKDYIRKKICKADKPQKSKVPGLIIDDDRYLKHLQRQPTDVKNNKHKRDSSKGPTGIRETADRRLKTERDFSQIEQIKIEPGSLKIEPGSLKIEPGSVKIEPGSSKIEPGSSKIEPGSSKIEPGFLKIEPGSLKIEPGSLKIEPGSLKIEPGSSKIEPGSSKIEPGSSKIEPGSSKIEPGSSKIEPGSSKIEPGSSKIEPGSLKIDQGPLKTDEDTKQIEQDSVIQDSGSHTSKINEDSRNGSLKKIGSTFQLERQPNKRETIVVKKEILSNTSVKKDASKTKEGNWVDEKNIPEIKISTPDGDISPNIEISINVIDSVKLKDLSVKEETSSIKIETSTEIKKPPSANLDKLSKVEISPSKLITPESYKLETPSKINLPESELQTAHLEKESKESKLTIDEKLIETIEDEKSFQKYPSSKDLLAENKRREPEVKKLKKCETKDKSKIASSSKMEPSFSIEAVPRFNCSFREPPKCCTFQQIICYPHSEPVILNDVFKNNEDADPHSNKNFNTANEKKSMWSKQKDQTSISELDNCEEDEEINENGDECESDETKLSNQTVLDGVSKEEKLYNQKIKGDSSREQKLFNQKDNDLSAVVKLSDLDKGVTEKGKSFDQIGKEGKPEEKKESVQRIKNHISGESKLVDQNIEDSVSGDAKFNDWNIEGIITGYHKSDQDMNEYVSKEGSKILKSFHVPVNKKENDIFKKCEFPSKHEYDNNFNDGECDTFLSENSFNLSKSDTDYQRDLSFYGIIKRMKAILSPKFCDFSRKLFCSFTEPCEPTNKNFQSDVIEIVYCVALGRRCLLVHWKNLECKKIYGYEISVDGCLVRRLNTPNCLSDVICGYDTSGRHLICVAPITNKCGKKKNSFAHPAYQMPYGSELGTPSYYAYEPYTC